MAHKFVCEVPGCSTQAADDDRERVRRIADEHMRAHHPEEAIDQAKMDGYIHFAGRVG